MVQAGHRLCCGDATLCEILTGMRARERSRTEECLRGFQYLPTSRAIGELAGQCRYEHRRQGVTLTLADVLIAAIAHAQVAVLLTTNPPHFPMPNLQIEELGAQP